MHGRRREVIRMVECLECNNQCWVSFQLADEAGDGKAYAGLAYELTDTEGTVYQGTLDANGKSIRHDDIPCGGAILSFSEKYRGGVKFYEDLIDRKSYKIPLTQLQYAAEQTQWLQEWSKTLRSYPDGAIKHHQLEVRDFVEKVMHLPVYNLYIRTSFGKFEWNVRKAVLSCIPSDKRSQVPNYGVGLEHNKHHILEIKALRALRPKLSLDQDFSALNLYQLSFLTAMAYTNLSCTTIKPESDPYYNYLYKANGSTIYGRGIGATLVSEWANHRETGFYGKASQKQKYAMLLEDVPYSKRFEIVPFDPDLYPQNSWDRRISNTKDPLAWNAEGRQETPDSVHFFDDSMLGYFRGDGTETQGFLTHNDKVLIVSIRGTQEFKDFLTDANALQVPIKEYTYKAYAHKGFHSAYAAIRPFIESYLDRFHTDQKIIVVGHSLGGAIATLTAEWIRQQTKYTLVDNKKVILYTYGSPRVGDLNFVANAQITHYRMVSENDPIPSVPGTWLAVPETSVQGFLTAGFGGYMVVKAFSGDSSKLYSHQGTLFHFTNLSLHNPQVLADELMWRPGCMGVQQCTKALELEAQLPDRASFGKQLMNMHDHFMFNSYIPFAHATFTRWKNSLENNTPVVSTQEITQLKTALINYRRKLNELAYTPSAWDFVPIVGYFRVKNKFELEAQAKAELKRVDQDLQRANTLAQKVITKEEFYGKDIANEISIETVYNTWLANDKQYRRPQDIPSVQS